MSRVPQQTSFIKPMFPTLVEAPPTGPDWVHEIKFDGFRAQVHVAKGNVTIYSRQGKDFSERFAGLRDRLAELPARSGIFDCEIIACKPDGSPDFYALLSRGGKAAGLCAIVFDVLALNGRLLTDLPLSERRRRLERVLKSVKLRDVHLSEQFSDGEQLLRAAERTGLEGIVSKRDASRYLSGTSRSWLKTKTAHWRAANQHRGELFAKDRKR